MTSALVPGAPVALIVPYALPLLIVSDKAIVDMTNLAGMTSLVTVDDHPVCPGLSCFPVTGAGRARGQALIECLGTTGWGGNASIQHAR